jgi:hypothetical protein
MVRADSVRKATFPFRLYGTLFLVAVALFLAWHFWRPQVRVARPTIELSPEKIVATAVVTNATSTGRSIAIHFVLGYETMGTDYSPSEFRILESRDISVRVGPHTTDPVQCEFARPPKPLAFRADAQIASVH